MEVKIERLKCGHTICYVSLREGERDMFKHTRYIKGGGGEVEGTSSGWL